MDPKLYERLTLPAGILRAEGCSCGGTKRAVWIRSAWRGCAIRRNGCVGSKHMNRSHHDMDRTHHDERRARAKTDPKHRDSTITLLSNRALHQWRCTTIKAKLPPPTNASRRKFKEKTLRLICDHFEIALRHVTGYQELAKKRGNFLVTAALERCDAVVVAVPMQLSVRELYERD